MARKLAPAWVVLVLACLPSRDAASQPRAITDNGFTVDLVEGPVLGASRIVGLGGAYTGLASGIDGSPWNPSGYGSRELWELDWFEWELDLGILLPTLFAANDFFNSGSDSGFKYDDFLFLNFGGRFIFGNVGLGALTRLRTFGLTDENGSRVNVNFGLTNFGAAHQFFDGQLVVGVGARVPSFTMTATMPSEEVVNVLGIGVEAGLLVRAAGAPWRIGAAARTPVRSGRIRGAASESADGIQRAGGFILPREVYLPWEVQVGFVYQFGPRPLNRRWFVEDHTRDGHRHDVTLSRFKRERDQVIREQGAQAPGGGEVAVEGAAAPDPYAWLDARAQDERWKRQEILRREVEDARFDEEAEARSDEREAADLAIPREYILVSTDLVVVGPTEDGIGVEGFLAQEEVASGRNPTVSVRLGVESEVVPTWLKLRVGSYLEPSRFEGGEARLHVTSGFDVRLFSWDLFGIFEDTTFRIGATSDIAERYFDWGISIGVWH